MRYVTDVLERVRPRGGTQGREPRCRGYFDGINRPAARGPRPRRARPPSAGLRQRLGLGLPRGGKLPRPAVLVRRGGFRRSGGYAPERSTPRWTRLAPARHRLRRGQPSVDRDRAPAGRGGRGGGGVTNPVTTYAVSDRMGNVQVHPQWGSCSAASGCGRQTSISPGNVPPLPWIHPRDGRTAQARG